MGTEELAMLVRGPVMVAGPGWGPEPGRGMRFCRRGVEGRRRKLSRALSELTGPLL